MQQCYIELRRWPHEFLRSTSDPMVLGPCRIMSDVLPMPALRLTPESTSWIRINHLKVSHEQLLVSTSMNNQVWGRKIKERRNGVQTFSDFLCHSDGDSIYPGFRSGLAANRK